MLANGTAEAARSPAVRIGLVAVLQLVIAIGRLTLIGGTDSTRAIASRSAMLWRHAGLAGSATIKVGLGTIHDAISALCALAEKVGTDLVLAVRVDGTPLASTARAAGQATAVHVGFRAILHFVVTLGQFANTIGTNAIGAIATEHALLARAATRADRATAVDIRFVLVLKCVVTSPFGDNASARAARIGGSTIRTGWYRTCPSDSCATPACRATGPGAGGSSTVGRSSPLSISSAPALSADGRLVLRHAVCRRRATLHDHTERCEHCYDKKSAPALR